MGMFPKPSYLAVNIATHRNGQRQRLRAGSMFAGLQYVDAWACGGDGSVRSVGETWRHTCTATECTNFRLLRSYFVGFYSVVIPALWLDLPAYPPR